VLLAALALVPAASADPTMTIGASEELVKSDVLAQSQAQLALATAAGLQLIRVTAFWQPGQSAPPSALLKSLTTTQQAATGSGVELMLSVYPASNLQVPLDDAGRSQFASFVAGIARAVPEIRQFIIGNEANLNFFWLPQYNADGTSAAPAAYTALLAQTYDALKGVDPEIEVIGGAVSPAGTDNPTGIRPSHSPGNFILGMGAAYRAMGRPTPIMDAFAFHPYGQRSKSPPSAQNPNSTRISLADYGKLVSFLGQAFDGTAQRGSTLPIVYDEYGVQTTPPPEKQALYTHLDSPSATDAVSEDDQASYYRQALQIAACQPNVKAFLFFHTVDETDARRWQSGVYYPDLTPKTSLSAVRRAVLEARRGIIASCPGLQVPVRPLVPVSFPGPRAVPSDNRDWRIVVGCVQDCGYLARLERFPGHSTTLATSGILVGGTKHTIRLPSRRVAPGSYRLTIRLTTRVNPGPALFKVSRPFTVG
jgi:hypothetical protein